MNLSARINAFAKLSEFINALVKNKPSEVPKNLKDNYFELENLIKNLKNYNAWFIEDFVLTQLKSIAESTQKELIKKWILPYSSQINNQEVKKVAVIMAGNIPFVGFHDFISVLITGHIFIGKLSSKDNKLPKKIAEILVKIEPRFSDYIIFQEKRLKNYDAVIATGSNNSARYFDYYFKDVNNIIRKNRNSVAVLTATETETELKNLANDIFLYFGLGCRNVSKIFVPENYNFDKIFRAVYDYKFLINHNKYVNNYEYNRAIYLLNNDKFLDNGFFIIKENLNLVSPVSVLHYETYKNLKNVENILKAQQNNIQCVVSNQKNIFPETIDFGKTQFPKLSNYEDRINTINFLVNL